MLRALYYLGINLNINSATSISSALSLAIDSWDPTKLRGIKHLPLEAQDLHFI